MMIKKSHRIVEPAAATNVIYQGVDGKVTQKHNRKGEGFKNIFDQKMEVYNNGRTNNGNKQGCI